MKKWNLFSVLFVFTICFSACDSGNEPAPTESDDDKNQPKNEVNNVNSILFSREGYSLSTSFLYDKQNRVVEIENYRPFGLNKKVTFEYTANTMFMKAGYTGYRELESGGFDEIDGEVEFTAQLNDSGYISSAISIWKDLDTNNNDTVYWTADYTNGYISKLAYYGDDEYVTQTTFSWSNGNLIRIEEDDQTDIIITYDYETKNSTTNLDINWSTNIGNVYSDDMLEFWVLPQFGFFGKRSNDLIKTVSQGDFIENYKYNFNDAGDLINCKIDEEFSFGFNYK